MIQYLYLNQLHDYTQGKLGAQQILHAAANGSIQLYAHTPDLADYGSRLSPISEKACPLVEMVYNTHCSYGEPEEFTGSEFLVAGEITKDMQEGREPFSYSLHKSHWDPDVARTQIFEPQDDTAKPTKIIVKLTGSDFIVLKDDVESLLKGSGTEEIDPRERATFLRLIRLLCELQDIDISKHNKAYDVLEAMAATKGLTMPGKKNTIANKLKDAREAE